MSTNNFIKPMAMVACVVAGDKFILGETDMNSSMYLGVAGGAGVFAAQMLAPSLPFEQFLPTSDFTDAKTLELRLLELGGAVGLGFVINKFILNNDPYLSIRMNKLALLAGADFAAEYIDDYMAGRALSFFK